MCGFDGATHNMKVVEMGKGGMARVKEILKDQFTDGTAIAMFRVTAVDDRENTVSYRTKLIHVIYTGPNTPVMKRAKITPFNAAFKQPFTFNLSIQTSDEDGDLTEVAIEKTLRASGGAHQPTRFDFTNCSAPGEGESKVNRKSEPSRSPTHASSPSSPARVTPKASPPPVAAEVEEAYATPSELLRRHTDAFDAKDADAIAADYAQDGKVVHIDASAQRSTVYTGQSEIAEYFRSFIESQGSSGIKVHSLDTEGNIATLEWSNQGAGYNFGFDVFYFSKGKITLQTITSVSGDSSSGQAVEPEATQDDNEVQESNDQAEGASTEWEAVETSEAPPAAAEESPQEEEESPAGDEAHEEVQEDGEEAQHEESPNHGEEAQYEDQDQGEDAQYEAQDQGEDAPAEEEAPAQGDQEDEFA